MMHKNIYIKILVGVLAVFCVAAIFSFVTYVRYGYYNGQLHPRRLHRAVFSRAVPIEGWMTFDYINKVYDIPPSYIATHLAITDIRYPYIGIDRYAKAHGIPRYVLIETVREIIASYKNI